MVREKVHFVTGRLAEDPLRAVVARLSTQVGFDYSVQVFPISVAALMTPDWIAARLQPPLDTTKVVLPGYCGGDLTAITRKFTTPVIVGPRDLRDLPEFFLLTREPLDWSQYDIEIISEINHAPRLSQARIVQLAEEMVRDGANRIDLGCDPVGGWIGVGDCVSDLVSSGIRVSIDSFDVGEVSAAVRAGADLVLSVNSTNLTTSLDLNCEVVVIPDQPGSWESMEESFEFLQRHGIRFRADPIVEPIGMGFAASLERYMQARRRWPEVPMMMGIGNITELADVDSAGINLLLIAICQELKIRSVLTTQVINWARTSVRECDWARRLVKQSASLGVPPKNLCEQLIMLRDPRVSEFGSEQLREMATKIRDGNYRLFSESDGLYALAFNRLWQANDPFELFDQLADGPGREIDASHAFYLGYELCKAEIARRLGKQYVQDEPLDWGFLTGTDPARHRLRRRQRSDPDSSRRNRGTSQNG
jgi:dihydropteroate synthase-like protein